MANKFYITTPLYYVNAKPHIGHSYTTIVADTLARYMRRVKGNENVWFLTGTDEHGQKIQKAADESGLSPIKFADGVVLIFKDLWKELNISYDDFIRTTEKRHIDAVCRVLEILHAKGDIYESQYEGWYCTPCESFWTESQVVQANLCPDCKRPVERIQEKNFFFRLSKYQDWLIKHIENNPDFVKPAIRNNEVLSFLRLNKLTDLCISRPKERLSWGIPLPFSPDHVTYVWFDALINYISAVGQFDDKGRYHSKWWPADLQLIGKDILRQHAIYWPIMLKALDIEPPKTVFAHGWWLIQDTKMSKSLGNVVSPAEMSKRFGVDAYRYFLLRDVPFGLDGNFSEDAIIKRINSDLANDLGNLVFRTLTMIEKYYNGNIPDVNLASGKLDTTAERILCEAKMLPNKVTPFLTATREYNFSIALEEIWKLINLANKHVEETKPWNLAKENKQRELEGFIRLLVEVIRAVADRLYAFMPGSCESITEQLGGDKIQKGAPLFPRIEIPKRT